MRNETIGGQTGLRLRTAGMVALALALFGSTAMQASSSAWQQSDMDPRVRPGESFFRFANGGWLDRQEIPDEQSELTEIGLLEKRRDQDLLALLENSLSGRFPSGSPAQMIADLYRTGMAVEAIEAQGLAPLREEMEMIGRMASISDLQQTLACLHTLRVPALFKIYVRQDIKRQDRYALHLLQDGLGLPDVAYYRRSDQLSQAILDRYRGHIQRVLELAGETSAEAATGAVQVLAIESRLAMHSKSRAEMRDLGATYHPMDLAVLQRLAPGIDWRRFFLTIGIVKRGRMIIGQPEYLTSVAALLGEIPISEWKSYLRWRLLDQFDSFLGGEFALERFRFYSEFLSGIKKPKDRKEMVLNVTINGLPDLIGRLYTETHFSDTSRRKMERLVGHLKNALRLRLIANPWLGPKTKVSALRKLRRMQVKIGRPRRWKEYAGLQIGRDSFLLNIKRISAFLFRENRGRLGKAVDREAWVIPAFEVNAAYRPQANEIVFPAGFLQPPVFDPAADDALNYGAIGFAIAHEMIHGFDDQGRKFDWRGNHRDWWTARDAAEFASRMEPVRKQFEAIHVQDLALDASLSMGEIIADLGGLALAHSAYQMSLDGRRSPSIDGLTGEQRFFLAFARVFRGKIRPEALRRRAIENKHPWCEFRVNGIPFHLPEFYQAFQIEPGDRLYILPQKRASLW